MQTGLWPGVQGVLMRELKALCRKKYEYAQRNLDNVQRSFDLVDNDPPKRNNDKQHTRTYFLAVMSSRELFVLSALAAGPSLIQTFKTQPEILASMALDWVKTIDLPARLCGLTIAFFAERPEMNERNANITLFPGLSAIQNDTTRESHSTDSVPQSSATLPFLNSEQDPYKQQLPPTPPSRSYPLQPEFTGSGTHGKKRKRDTSETGHKSGAKDALDTLSQQQKIQQQTFQYHQVKPAWRPNVSFRDITPNTSHESFSRSCSSCSQSPASFSPESNEPMRGKPSDMHQLADSEVSSGAIHATMIPQNDRAAHMAMHLPNPNPDLISANQSVSGITYDGSKLDIEPEAGSPDTNSPVTRRLSATSIIYLIGPISQGSLVPAEIDPFTGEGAHNTTVNPQTISLPELRNDGLFSDQPIFQGGGEDPIIKDVPELRRSGGVRLFSEWPGFRQGGVDSMIDGKQESKTDGKPESELRRDGGVRLFERGGCMRSGLLYRFPPYTECGAEDLRLL